MVNSLLLEKQFKSLEKYCDGTLGVSAIHIESHRKVDFNAENRFLMCSTYKFPIAIYILTKVEKGEMSLNDICTVSETDLRPGIISALNALNYDVPQQISVHSLLQLMMQDSCNTATDILLNKIGGAIAIHKFLQQINLHGIDCDNYSLESYAAWEGIKELPKNCTLTQFKELENQVPAEQRAQARTQVKADIEKTGEGTTLPSDMTALLVMLFKTELISSFHTELLFKIMRHRLLDHAPYSLYRWFQEHD